MHRCAFVLVGLVAQVMLRVTVWIEFSTEYNCSNGCCAEKTGGKTKTGMYVRCFLSIALELY